MSDTMTRQMHRDDGASCGCTQQRTRSGSEREIALMLAWASEHGSTLLPAEEVGLRAYVRAHRGRIATSTIRKRLDILRAEHRAAGLPWPDVRVSEIIAETADVGEPAIEPLDDSLLDRVAEAFDDRDWRDVRDAALLRLGLAARLHPHELLGLRPRDVQSDANGLHIDLRQQSWLGPLTIGPAAHRAHEAVEAWLRLRDANAITLFYERTQQGTVPLDAVNLARIVRGRLRAAGCATRGFGAASIRGAALAGERTRRDGAVQC